MRRTLVVCSIVVLAGCAGSTQSSELATSETNTDQIAPVAGTGTLAAPETTEEPTGELRDPALPTNDQVHDWYPDEVVEHLNTLNPAERAAFVETMAIFEPRLSGPLSQDEAIGRALLFADGEVDPVAARGAVEVIETTWAGAAELTGKTPDSDLRLAKDSPILAVVVHLPVTNTDVPSGAKPTTYESFVVLYEPRSAFGFNVCFGCG